MIKAVRVGDLRIHAAPAGELRAEADRVDREAAASLAESTAQVEESGLLLAGVGAELADPGTGWVPVQRAARTRLKAVQEAMERTEALVPPAAGEGTRKGFARFLARPRETPREVQQQREQQWAELQRAYVDLGRAGGAQVPGTASAHATALSLEAAARRGRERARRQARVAAALRAEADKRDRAVAQMGFDAPLLAAQLRIGSSPVAEWSVALRPGEAGLLAVDAELARERAFAAAPRAAQGSSLPLELTGIPFALGVPRVGPVARESLSLLGAGSLVVTTERVVFTGKLKSFAFSITDLVHVEYFAGGVVLLRAERTNADVILLQEPMRLVFYLNWALRLRA